MLADSVLLLDVTDGVHALTDDREAEIGRRFRARMDSLPTDSAEHGDAYREYVETLRAHRNQSGGFWVAGPDPEAAKEAISGSIPRAELRAAALLSDGASRLVDRFHLIGWDDAFAILRDEGPGELIRRVREAEASDPTGQRWPRGKARDDATAVYCLTTDATDTATDAAHC